MKKFFILAVLAASAGILQTQGIANSGYYQGQPQQGYNSQYGGQGQYGGTQGMPYQNGQSGDTSDQGINSQIQSTLNSSQYQGRYSNVQANVSNGNVTLSGTVNSQDDKDRLGGIIGGINGVRSVTNQVQVQGNGSSGNGSSYQGGYGGNHGYGNGSTQSNYPSSTSPQSNY